MLKSNVLTIVLSALILASCNALMDDGNCPESGSSLRTVTFTLAMDDVQKQTRAAWGDGYVTDGAVDFENRIAYDGLRVVFYRASDNAYLGEAAEMMYWLANPAKSDEYRVTGDVSPLNLIAGTEYKIMVLANCPAAGGNQGGMVYDMAGIAYPQGAIPMWGVACFVASGEELQNVGTIDLLRSMAKIEVVLSNEMLANGYTLNAVQLAHHNSLGYCLPSKWNEVSRTSELDMENCIRPLHSHVSSPVSLKEIDDGKRYWIYVPEFNVLHTAVNRPVIGVKLGDGTSVPLEFPDAIRFGSYDAGGDFVEGSEHNIVRNHIYRFNIMAIASGLEIGCEVLPWEDGGIWERGEFAYPTYHNPLVPDYANPAARIDVAPVMKYNNTSTPEDDAFVAWFKLTKPSNQLWTPVIDKSDTEYEIRVYNEAGDLLTDPDDWKAADGWYRIVVIPLNAANSGDVVKFGITYTQEWMPVGTSMYLLINGKADEIAWPGSGSDPKIIEIRQM